MNLVPTIFKGFIKLTIKVFETRPVSIHDKNKDARQ